jgi:RHS repeat-associated protein
VIPHEKQLFGGRRRIVKSWHRFYDPTTGRYISADPIGLGGGINLYGYAHQNPVNWADPDGLRCITIGYEKRPWKVVSTGDPVWKHVSTVFADGWAHGTSFWKIETTIYKQRQKRAIKLCWECDACGDNCWFRIKYGKWKTEKDIDTDIEPVTAPAYCWNATCSIWWVNLPGGRTYWGGLD